MPDPTRRELLAEITAIGEEIEATPIELPKGFGQRNPHCSNCGDERGGDFGHEISECKYRSGMTAEDLAATMTPDKARRYWDVLLDRYFEAMGVDTR